MRKRYSDRIELQAFLSNWQLFAKTLQSQPNPDAATSIVNCFKSSLHAAMAVLLMGAMTSCSEEKEGKFDTPKFVADAAKYVIDNAQAEYASIELTESGNYIITPNQMSNARRYASAEEKKTNKLSLLKNSIWNNPDEVPATRYEVYSHILYGKYTKTSENVYTLDGYGTLTIKKDDSGSSFSIVLTPFGMDSKEYTAHQMNADLNSGMSDKLCRTWIFESFKYYVKLNGKTMLELSANSIEELLKKMKAWAEKNDPEFDPSDWEDALEGFQHGAQPDNMIFTKTGTYVVFYSTEELAVSTWKWKNEKKGILHYCWNPAWIDDPYEGGDVKIEFKNNKLHVTEFAYELEDEDYEEGITYILHEMK